MTFRSVSCELLNTLFFLPPGLLADASTAGETAHNPAGLGDGELATDKSESTQKLAEAREKCKAFAYASFAMLKSLVGDTGDALGKNLRLEEPKIRARRFNNGSVVDLEAIMEITVPYEKERRRTWGWFTARSMDNLDEISLWRRDLRVDDDTVYIMRWKDPAAMKRNIESTHRRLLAEGRLNFLKGPDFQV